MLKYIQGLPKRHVTPFIRHSSTILAGQDFYDDRKKRVGEASHEYYKTLGELRFKDAKRVRIPEFRQLFEGYDFPESHRIDELYTIEGKITSIRRAGKGMIFIDVVQDLKKVQLVVMNKLVGLSKEEFYKKHENFHIGDFILAKGYPGTTNVGELSLKCSDTLRLASPSLQWVPPKLTHSDKRHHNRVLDFLVNKDAQQAIIIRSVIINTLRNFLTERGFLEVSTPIIANSSKGANATPFTTTSQHIKDKDQIPLDLQLRVAPELWLKKLVIGGFEKVFEIGPVFRNEGIDGTHNPEFTTCEFYQSYTDLEELMSLTELFFQKVAEALERFPNAQAASELILENSSFPRLEFIPTIEEQSGRKFPSEITPESLEDYFNQLNIPLPAVKSTPQLLDKLSSTFIEPLCDKPTFIYHQPSIMSPLAKDTTITYPSGETYLISRRFELFIKGKEYVNAYEEENSPFEQNFKFKLQQQLKDDFNDEESIVPDEKYVTAMEYGMPPTGGWGIGLDRMSMLFSGKDRIEEVLTFGTVNDVLKQ